MTRLAFRLRMIFAGVQPPLPRHALRRFGRITGNSEVIHMPGKSRYRTSGFTDRHLSGNRVNQDLANF
jgi:hypothetical protein